MKYRTYPQYTIGVCPISNVIEFEKNYPKNCNDFDKENLYELVVQLENGEEKQIPVQIESLRRIETAEQLDEYKRDRGRFPKLNLSVIQRYKGSDRDQNETYSDDSVADDDDNENALPVVLDKPKKDVKRQTNKINKKKIEDLAIEQNKKILQQKISKMKSTSQLVIDANSRFIKTREEIEKETTSSVPNQNRPEWHEQYDNLVTEFNKMKIKYEQLIVQCNNFKTERDDYQSKCTKLEAQVYSLTTLNIKLQERILLATPDVVRKIGKDKGSTARSPLFEQSLMQPTKSKDEERNTKENIIIIDIDSVSTDVNGVNCSDVNSQNIFVDPPNSLLDLQDDFADIVGNVLPENLFENDHIDDVRVNDGMLSNTLQPVESSTPKKQADVPPSKQPAHPYSVTESSRVKKKLFSDDDKDETEKSPSLLDKKGGEQMINNRMLMKGVIQKQAKVQTINKKFIQKMSKPGFSADKSSSRSDSSIGGSSSASKEDLSDSLQGSPVFKNIKSKKRVMKKIRSRNQSHKKTKSQIANMKLLAKMTKKFDTRIVHTEKVEDEEDADGKELLTPDHEDYYFTKFMKRWDDKSSRKLIRMIRLSDFLSIDKATWKRMKSVDIQKFVKRLLQILYDDDPSLLAVKCVRAGPLVLTPNGKNKRTELSPIKKLTLNRCVRQYHKDVMGITLKSELDALEATGYGAFITDGIKQAIRAVRSKVPNAEDVDD